MAFGEWCPDVCVWVLPRLLWVGAAQTAVVGCAQTVVGDVCPRLWWVVAPQAAVGGCCPDCCEWGVPRLMWVYANKRVSVCFRVGGITNCPSMAGGGGVEQTTSQKEIVSLPIVSNDF